MGYYDGGKGECLAIEQGMRKDVAGMTLKSLSLESGWWRRDERSDDVRKCKNPLACTGGNITSTCQEGHTGPYCSICKDGYTLDAFEMCEECSTNTTQLIIVVLAVVLAVVGVVGINVILKKRLKRLGREERVVWKMCKNGIKVLFASYQIIAAFASVIPAVSLPENYKKVMKFM